MDSQALAWLLSLVAVVTWVSSGYIYLRDVPWATVSASALILLGVVLSVGTFVVSSSGRFDIPALPAVFVAFNRAFLAASGIVVLRWLTQMRSHRVR